MDLWTGNWVESDPEGVEQDPSIGFVQILDGALRLNNLNGNGQPSITRPVALSHVTSAKLDLDFLTFAAVSPADGILIEISPDGGTQWLLLDTIENLSGTEVSSRKYDIVSFVTPESLIRLRVANGYNQSDKLFYLDNVEVTYTFDGEAPARGDLSFFADDFDGSTYKYNNDAGSEEWLGKWTERGESNGPLAGDIHVTDYEGRRVLTFWTDNDPSWEAVRGVTRAADLSSADWAEVNFLYSRDSMEEGDYVFVEASADGGPWVKVGYIEGKGTDEILGMDQGWRYASFDISEFISTNTAVRLFSDFVEDDSHDNIYFDDFKIVIDQFTGEIPPNYYLETLKVEPVWNMGYDGNGITVAVIDSGISLDYDFSTHPGERNASRIKFQEGFNNNSSLKHDVFGHGTHVAGIIAGNGSRSNGLYKGVAPGTNLVGLKVSDEQGMAYESDTVAAMQWVYENKDAYNIRVVNLSIQSMVEQPYDESALNLAAEILWFSGIVVVTSAGNEWNGEYFNTVKAAPANDPFIITVGASDEQGNGNRSDDVISPFSARGFSLSGYYKPEIITPGKDIVSTLAGSSEWRNQHPDRFAKGGYFRISGTSMATPMVAGAAALLLQAEPDLTPDQVKYRMISTGGLVEFYPYLDIHAALTTPTTESYNWNVKPHKVLAQMALIAYWANENGDENTDWAAVNWNTVNWNAVNWNAVNWNAVNWED